MLAPLHAMAFAALALASPNEAEATHAGVTTERDAIWIDRDACIDLQKHRLKPDCRPAIEHAVLSRFDPQVHKRVFIASYFETIDDLRDLARADSAATILRDALIRTRAEGGLGLPSKRVRKIADKPNARSKRRKPNSHIIELQLPLPVRSNMPIVKPNPNVQTK